MGAVIAVIANTAYMYFAGRTAIGAITEAEKDAIAEDVHRADDTRIRYDDGFKSSRSSDHGPTAARGLYPRSKFSTENLEQDHLRKPEDIPTPSRPGENYPVKTENWDTSLFKTFRACLTKCRECIMDGLEDLEDILAYLVSIQAVSRAQNDVIISKNTVRNKVRELLDCVDRRGEEACRYLVAALRDTEQLHLCQLSANLRLQLDKIPVRDVLSIDQYMTEMKGNYQQKIKYRNEQEQTQYGNSISLDQHAPLMINHGHRPPDGQTRKGFNEFNIQKTDRKQLTLDSIFLSDDERCPPHSVLMLGGPGMGKTSLCFTILNRFACGQWGGGHQYIFFMLLKELGDMGLSLTLADILFDYTQTTQTQKGKLIRQLQKRPRRILFLLDGYDEHDEFMTDNLTIYDPSTKAHPAVILRSLVRGALLPESQVLLTSRPFRQIDLRVDRVVELAGLSNQSVNTLLGTFLVGELGSETAAFLKNHEDVTSMLSIPINIQKFLSYLTWLRDNAKLILPNLPKTKSSLYSKQMLPVLTQCLRSKDIHLYDEQRIWHHPVVQSFLCQLAKLAGSAINEFGKKQIVFEPSDLERCKLTENNVKTGGLMSAFTKQSNTPSGIRPLVYFYFQHLTTFEWCGGLDTASRDLNYIENLIVRNDGNLDVVLIFCAGLLGALEGQLILERLYEIPEHECKQKALRVLNKIVHSDRCRKPGGPQFALEVFFEASFVDPRPLLSLLAPDGKTLEIADVALSNRQAVGYFVEQLNSSQSKQVEVTGTLGVEIGLDTVRLHFSRAANRSVQNSMVSEVCGMKKLRHLLIETDGDCAVVVERPLDMLLMRGETTRDCTALVIETSHSSTLCLYHTGRVCHLPPSARLSQHLQEIHLWDVTLHSNTLTSIASTTSLRAVTGLRYSDDTAAAIRHVIQETPALKVLGVRLVTRDASYCVTFSRVLSTSNIACLSLCVNPDDACHMAVLEDVVSNVSSLRELWLEFYRPPTSAELADLAWRVCQHNRLITLSLVGYSAPIDITCFLKQLVDEPHSVRHIYTDNAIRSDSDVVRRFKGDLLQVRRGDEGTFFTPLVYSNYLLTSIPSHIKKVLTRRYISLD